MNVDVYQDEERLKRMLTTELFKVSGHEALLKFSYMVTSILSEDDTNDWSQINQFLSSDTQQGLMQLLVRTLLHANRIGQLNRVGYRLAKCSLRI